MQGEHQMKYLKATPRDFALYYDTFYRLTQDSSVSFIQEKEQDFGPYPIFNKATFYSAIGQGNIDQVDKLLQENFIYIINDVGESSIRAHKQKIQSSIEAITLFLLQNEISEEIVNYMSRHFLSALYDATTANQSSFIHYLAIKEFTRLSLEYQRPFAVSDEIKQCIFYMCNHDMKKATLSEIASSVGMNERQLSKLFQNELNQSIHTFFHMQRIAFSIFYIAYSDLPFAKVASLFHYSDIAYYSKLFKQYTNYTPKDFRNQYAIERKALIVKSVKLFED